MSFLGKPKRYRAYKWRLLPKGINMEPGVALDISREALMQIAILSAPLLTVALVVGVVISLFQAVTQIQEMTLTFVPKIFAMAIAMVIFLPFMLNKIMMYAEKMFGPIPLP